MFAPRLHRVLLWVGALLATAASAWTLVNPDNVPSEYREYDELGNFCRIWTHRSDHIVIDGGCKVYQVLTSNSTSLHIVELNGHTLILDVSKSFSARGSLPLTSLRKSTSNPRVPVLIRHTLWRSDSLDDVYMAAGLFQDDFGGDQSEFFTKKEDIPVFSIWRFNLKTRAWAEEPFNFSSRGRLLERTYAGAGVSVPKLNLSFYQGGLYDNRTSPRHANLSGDHPQDGMLIFNHTDNTIRNRSLSDSIGARDQYWGTLQHFPLGTEGFLLSLQAEQLNLSSSLANRRDYGPSVSWSTVRLYDVQNDKWLWIYGGQIGTGANATGVDDIWVLSLPGFRWFKVLDPYTENRRRSATCHMIGKYLFVIGGNDPQQEDIVESANCDSGLVKIYDMNTQAWMDRFEVNGGKYKPFKEITDWYGEYGMRPLDGYDHPETRALLEIYRPREGREIGIVIGSICAATVATVVAVFVYHYRRYIFPGKGHGIETDDPPGLPSDTEPTPELQSGTASTPLSTLTPAQTRASEVEAGRPHELDSQKRDRAEMGSST
ncbi:MAG: hypothetical protein M1840_005143 [Geoglossum simile]|nr:MAG: hypothetical protein M1840_005143 [Geoglossum simile]